MSWSSGESKELGGCHWEHRPGKSALAHTDDNGARLGVRPQISKQDFLELSDKARVKLQCDYQVHVGSDSLPKGQEQQKQSKGTQSHPEGEPVSLPQLWGTVFPWLVLSPACEQLKFKD